MFDYVIEANFSKISMPKIGAGLGSLKWDNIKAIIEKTANQFPTIELFVVENYG